MKERKKKIYINNTYDILISFDNKQNQLKNIYFILFYCVVRRFCLYIMTVTVTVYYSM